MNFNVNYFKCLTWMQRDLSSALIEPTGHASQENCHTPDWLLLNFPVGQVWQRPVRASRNSPLAQEGVGWSVGRAVGAGIGMAVGAGVGGREAGDNQAGQQPPPWNSEVNRASWEVREAKGGKADRAGRREEQQQEAGRIAHMAMSTRA